MNPRRALLLALLPIMACGPQPIEEISPTPRPELDMIIAPENGAVDVGVGQPLTVFFTRPVGSVRFDVRRASAQVLGQAFVSTDRQTATFRPVGNAWRSGTVYDAVIEAVSLGETITGSTRFTIDLAAGLPLSLVGRTWDLAAASHPDFPLLQTALDDERRILLTLLELDADDGAATLVVRYGAAGAPHSGGVDVDRTEPRAHVLQGNFEGNRLIIPDPGILPVTVENAVLTLLFDAGADRVEEWRFDGRVHIEDLIEDACVDADPPCDAGGFVETVIGGTGRSNPLGTVPFFLTPMHGDADVESTDVRLRWTADVDVSALSLYYNELDTEGLPIGPDVPLSFSPQVGPNDRVSVTAPAPFPAGAGILLTAEHPAFSPGPAHWIEFTTAP